MRVPSIFRRAWGMVPDSVQVAIVIFVVLTHEIWLPVLKVVSGMYDWVEQKRGVEQ